MLVVKRLLCTAETDFYAVLEKHFVVQKLRKQLTHGKTSSTAFTPDLYKGQISCHLWNRPHELLQWNLYASIDWLLDCMKYQRYVSLVLDIQVTRDKGLSVSCNLLALGKIKLHAMWCNYFLNNNNYIMSCHLQSWHFCPFWGGQFDIVTYHKDSEVRTWFRWILNQWSQGVS